MTYSSSGPSLAQALDMDVDPSPSTLSPSSSDLPDLHDSRSHPRQPHSQAHSRSGSHPHHHVRSDSTSKSNAHRHRAHLHQHERRDTGVNDLSSGQDSDDHLHSNGRNSDGHHSHQRLHRRKTPANLNLQIREPDNAPANDLNPREEQSLVTQVVQTVSLVQVVDSVGSPIELQTHYGQPATVVVDSASGSTVAISNPDPSPSVAAAASNPAATYNAPPQSSDAAAAPAETDTPDMTEPEPSTLLPDVTASGSVPDPVSDTTLVPTTDVSSDYPSDTLPETSVATSSDLDTASQDTATTAVPSSAIDTTASDVSGAQNTTTIATTTDDLSTTTANPTTLTETTDLTSEVTSEATTEATTDASTSEPGSTVLKNILSTSNTRTLTSSTITVVSSSFVTSSVDPTSYPSDTIYSDSVYSTISTETWTSTWWGGDDDSDGGNADATAVAQPTATTSSSGSNDTDSSSTLSPQQKQVIGGVVGSVAGVAFLALLVLFAFRYKKRQPAGGILGENGPATRAIGGPDGGSGGAMAERSGGFSVAAALAGLTGKNKQQPPEPAPTGERGFYRVSGKKLPSVLQVGGDGYSDPRTNRESVMSGHSDYWRGSQAFDPGDRDSNRLALGSPMRPVSGVPVIRTGPARTPVTEGNPFSDPPSRPRPDSDALGGSIGGSIASQDGSFGSPSRFQERI